METVNVKGYAGDVAILGTDKDVVAVFHMGTRFNEVKSKEAGAPIFDRLPFLKVIHPGEPLNVYDQPVREQDKWRFRQQWEAFEKGGEQSVSGTPLAILFPWNPEIVESMAAVHIRTIEQLANLSDTAKQNVMFGQNLSQKAKEFLSVADKGREYHELKQRDETKTNQINELVKTVNELRHTIEELRYSASPAPKRRGRPPKVVQPETTEAA